VARSSAATANQVVSPGCPQLQEGPWSGRAKLIQFNANPDGTFSPLPAKHVDTGMGFERVTSIIQGTKGFSDFKNAKISNYETDIFRPIFDAIEKLSGKRYGSTLPKAGSTGDTEQEKIDVAFRVIADHIRTLSFAIADGIQPGNTDRNYVLRRILRRAVRYGRTLGFHEPLRTPQTSRSTCSPPKRRVRRARCASIRARRSSTRASR
jgi:alanyl-tRNA synthetase